MREMASVLAARRYRHLPHFVFDLAAEERLLDQALRRIIEPGAAERLAVESLSSQQFQAVACGGRCAIGEVEDAVWGKEGDFAGRASHLRVRLVRL
jgi:hypothetical protein